MALTLVTSDLILGLDYGKLTGTIPTWNQNTTGNADTATLAAGATILATARNINSVAFDGSADITIVDATKLPLAGGTLTGALSGTSATFSSGVTAGGKGIFETNTTVGNDGTYTGYASVGLGGTTNGFNRVFGGVGTYDGLFLASATGTGIYFRPNGGTADSVVITSGGNVGIGTTNPSSYTLAPQLVLDTGTSGGITIKSGSSNYGGVYFADGTTGNEQYRGYIQYSHNYSASVDEMLFGTGGATRLTISSGGVVSIPNGVVFNNNATGGTPNATNVTLNDYEEGTFTVTLNTSNGNASVSSARNTGLYVRVGNQVSVQFYSGAITVATLGTGVARISGLPYQSAITDYHVLTLTHVNCFASLVQNGYVDPGAAYFSPILSNGINIASWKNASSTYFMLGGTYLI
jgi:hypothetical protein